VRVHLITNLFAPDELAGAALFSDLALYLKERGHDVRVTSTFSYYPTRKLRPEDVGVRFRDDEFQGIPVRRVAMYVGPPTGRNRLLSDLTFLAGLIRRGRPPNWTPEVIVTLLPMLSECLALRFPGLSWGIPRLIVVQDFAVDAALELKILSLPGFSFILHAIERFALLAADTVTTISPAMLTKVRHKLGNRERRTRLIPNWIHQSLAHGIAAQLAQPVARLNRSLFYSGNLGIKQGLPEFIDTFALAQTDWELRVYGGGAELERLRQAADQCPSVHLGETLDEASYIGRLRAASVCLITQRPGIGANFLPSKLLPALATGTPVLAVCDSHSPLGEEVTAGRFGEVVAPGDPRALAATLRRWSANPDLLAEMGRLALVRAAEYSRDKILPAYEEELQLLVSSRNSKSAR
jgi:colanic acid biosynthesis glycosyl transferase WcaI